MGKVISGCLEVVKALVPASSLRVPDKASALEGLDSFVRRPQFVRQDMLLGLTYDLQPEFRPALPSDLRPILYGKAASISLAEMIYLNLATNTCSQDTPPS
jgi:hypothetical protein